MPGWYLQLRSWPTPPASFPLSHPDLTLRCLKDINKIKLNYTNTVRLILCVSCIFLTGGEVTLVGFKRKGFQVVLLCLYNFVQLIKSLLVKFSVYLNFI